MLIKLHFYGEPVDRLFNLAVYSTEQKRRFDFYVTRLIVYKEEDF